MPKLGTNPALALGITAAVVMGVTGVSQARVAGTTPTGTTPSSMTGHGPGGRGGAGADDAALAKALGISVTDLQAAIKAVRDSETKPDPAADRASEAKTIADALGVDQATIQKVLDAQKPTAREGMPKGPAGTTPGVRATTPASGYPSDTTPTGTTPPAGGPRGGGHGPGHGGPGASADNVALITAIAKATGKDETTVKAALTNADTVEAAARTARQAEFAKKLAAKLGLDASKVATAIDSSRPTPPARAAKQSSSQNG